MSITGPLKRHAGISCAVSIPLLIVGFMVAYAICAYTLPETWQVAVISGDYGSFFTTIALSLVIILFFSAPGLIAIKDAVDKYSEAIEYDKHTKEDDKNPYGSYTVKDDGLYKGSRKVRSLSPGELAERKALSDGGLSGYNEAFNEAINEGRR